MSYLCPSFLSSLPPQDVGANAILLIGLALRLSQSGDVDAEYAVIATGTSALHFGDE